MAAMKKRREARLAQDRKIAAIVPSFVTSQIVVKDIQ